MVAVQTSITVDDRIVQAALARLGSHLDDMTEPMDEIGVMLVSSVTHRFETGVGPDGRPWIPSARALSEGGQTLVMRGHLRDSQTHVAGPRSVEVGTNLVYGAVHQFGGRAGRGLSVTLPARPYLGLDGDDEAEILDIINDWIGGGLP